MARQDDSSGSGGTGAALEAIDSMATSTRRLYNLAEQVKGEPSVREAIENIAADLDSKQAVLRYEAGVHGSALTTLKMPPEHADFLIGCLTESVTGNIEEAGHHGDTASLLALSDLLSGRAVAIRDLQTLRQIGDRDLARSIAHQYAEQLRDSIGRIEVELQRVSAGHPEYTRAGAKQDVAARLQDSLKQDLREAALALDITDAVAKEKPEVTEWWPAAESEGVTS